MRVQFDASLRRIEPAPSPPNGTRFVWDGDVIAVEERFGGGGGSKGNGRGTGGIEDRTYWHFEPETFVPLLREGGDGTLLHVLSDHLRTARELIAPDGEVRWSVSLRLWGKVRDQWRAANDNAADLYSNPGNNGPSVPESCPVRFPGQWHDPETGLYDNRFRTYDPNTGQYTSSDPIGLNGGFRGSGYVTNPLYQIDHLGLQDFNLNPKSVPTWGHTL